MHYSSFRLINSETPEYKIIIVAILWKFSQPYMMETIIKAFESFIIFNA